MALIDRRVAPRKTCAIPVRFIIHQEGSALPGNVVSIADNAVTLHEGQALDLSERGVAFKSRAAIALGQSLEIFFTLPTELTGRIPEDVRCTARVVHVGHSAESQGGIRVGANIQRFESLSPGRESRI